MRQIYGALLAWLAHTGQLVAGEGPADRLTPARLVTYLTARRQAVSANVIFNNLRMLAMTLNCLAPGREWGWIYRHPQAPRRQEAAESRRPVPIVKPGVLLGRLLDALRASVGTISDKAAAVRFRDQLLVAIGVCTALRPRNLHALTLGRSMRRLPSTYEIRYLTGHSKTGRPITIHLMPELTPLVDHYVDQVRPLLLNKADTADGALWVSGWGRRLSGPNIYLAFQHATKEFAGKAVYAQAFRHCGVTALMNQDPRAIETAAALLAHDGPTSTARFYDLSGDGAVEAVWTGLIAKYQPTGSKPLLSGRSKRPKDSG